MPVQPVADGISDSAARILQGRILPGDHLGHFELVQYIGGGGMGRVFRALDTRLARTVALKVLSPDQAADRDTLLRFQNEAQSAARLDHDNIARVYYVGEDRGLHFIVFEFIEGVNVRELVEAKGPLPLAEAISYTLQTAEALAHAAAPQRRPPRHQALEPADHAGRPGQADRHGPGAAAGGQQRGRRPDGQRRSRWARSTTSRPSRPATRAMPTCAATCIRWAARFFTC